MLENEAVEPLTRSCSIDEEGPAVPVQNIQEGISKKFILLITCLCALCDCLLLSVIVPIIPVYLNEDKPNARLQDSDAINSTRNSSFASGPSSATSDSSMDFKIGALFASKAFVQIVVNPFTGFLTERIGYNIPLFSGFCILFFSTLGLAMLAAAHPDDEERGTAIGIAMGTTALGVLAGPPFGGLFYSLAGKGLPFFILAGFIFITFVLVVIVRKPVIPRDAVKPSLKDLLSDPYILIASGAICFCNMSFALLEPTLPIWLLETVHAKKWQIGVIFLPSTGAYLIATPLFGKLGNKIGRWLVSLIGLVLVSISLSVVPAAKTLPVLVAPLFALGFSVGIVDASMAPALAFLVDTRHASVYGSVFAIADFAASVGFAFGPLIGGLIVAEGSFSWLLRGLAILNLLFAPLLLFLRNPPKKHQILQNEEMQVMDDEREG
ncbi:synaptic vesicular amine transporter-like isoform X2 [Acropora muricata]|uniref:synaptic vesicular amine transporter-like isoform X2 n=1 Tax=Acropora muricata TaxID=159855 RepID=UPI0034E3EEB5